MKYSKEEVADAREVLTKLCTEGTTVYCILRGNPSRSGMSRKISFFVVADGQLRSISFHVSRLLGYALERDYHALKVSGCGMDMGFAVVYALSVQLFGHDDRGGYKLRSEWV